MGTAFVDDDGAVLTIEEGENFVITIDEEYSIKLTTDQAQQLRDWLGLHVANTPKQRTPVEGDSRWAAIVEGANKNPDNTFLVSLLEQGQKWGELTEKQLSAGAAAAMKG